MTTDDNVLLHREKYVGGSDVPIILGISPYKTAFELAKEKAQINERPFDSSAYTEYGNIMEPIIRDHINAENSMNFEPATRTDEKKQIRCNVDGYERDRGILLEIKTHGATMRNDAYFAQIQFYLHNFTLDQCWLATYRRPKDFETNLDSYRLNPDELYIQFIDYDAAYAGKIMAAVGRFWQQVDALKQNPNMSEFEFYSIGNAEIMAIVSKLSEFETEIKRLKALEKEAGDLRKELLTLMENTGMKQINTGNVVITYIAPTERKTVNTKALADDMPEIFEKYISLTPVKASVKVKTIVHK